MITLGFTKPILGITSKILLSNTYRILKLELDLVKMEAHMQKLMETFATMVKAMMSGMTSGTAEPESIQIEEGRQGAPDLTEVSHRPVEHYQPTPMGTEPRPQTTNRDTDRWEGGSRRGTAIFYRNGGNQRRLTYAEALGNPGQHPNNRGDHAAPGISYEERVRNIGQSHPERVGYPSGPRGEGGHRTFRQPWDRANLDRGRPREIRKAPSDTEVQSLGNLLFRICQLKQSRRNWTTMPRSIGLQLDRIFINIKPPQSSEELDGALSRINESCKNELTATILDHIEGRSLDIIGDILKYPEEKFDEAAEWARRKTLDHFGQRVDRMEVNGWLREVCDIVTRQYVEKRPSTTGDIATVETDNTATTPRGEWTRSSLKRGRTEVRSPAEESNRFAPLLELDEDGDVNTVPSITKRTPKKPRLRKEHTKAPEILEDRIMVIEDTNVPEEVVTTPEEPSVVLAVATDDIITIVATDDIITIDTVFGGGARITGSPGAAGEVDIRIPDDVITNEIIVGEETRVPKTSERVEMTRTRDSTLVAVPSEEAVPEDAITEGIHKPDEGIPENGLSKEVVEGGPAPGFYIQGQDLDQGLTVEEMIKNARSEPIDIAVVEESTDLEEEPRTDGLVEEPDSPAGFQTESGDVRLSLSQPNSCTVGGSIRVHTAPKSKWHVSIIGSPKVLVLADDNITRTGQIPKDWEVHICNLITLDETASIIEKLEITGNLKKIVTITGWHNKNRSSGILRDINAIGCAARKKNIELHFVGVSCPKNQLETAAIKEINTVAERKFGNYYIQPISTAKVHSSQQGTKAPGNLSVSECYDILNNHFLGLGSKNRQQSI